MLCYHYHVAADRPTPSLLHPIPMHAQLESILKQLNLLDLLPTFKDHEVDDQLLPTLTDEELKEMGVEKLGHRKKLLTAFSRLAQTKATAPPVARATPPPPIPQKPSASASNPLINSMGMPFVSIPESKVLLCIWPVRCLDFAVFCKENFRDHPVADFPQGPDHPVVNITWQAAMEFCKWLTKKEASLGLLGGDRVYRLPSDREWSAAVGLSFESGNSPKARSGKAEGYPWGGEFPPPEGSGNYHSLLRIDDHSETSPVGFFPANKFGFYDLGGNVWEWCYDEFERGSGQRVLRGASCFNDDPEILLSSFRDKCAQDRVRNNNGFRLALGPLQEAEPWF